MFLSQRVVVSFNIIIFPTLPHSALKQESPNATKTFLNACKFQGRANGWISISDVSSLPCLLTIRIRGIRSIYTLVSSLDVFWTLFIMLWLVLAQKLGLSGRYRQLANKLKYNLTFFKAALTKDVIIWIEKSYWIPFSKDIPLSAWLCINTKISTQTSFPPTALSWTVNLLIEKRYEEIWLNDFVIGIHIWFFQHTERPFMDSSYNKSMVRHIMWGQSSSSQSAVVVSVQPEWRLGREIS